MRTCEGDESETTLASVTVVRPVLESCLMSCFFLSNSPLPRRSLIVSLYYAIGSECAEQDLNATYDLKKLAFHLVLPALALELLCYAEYLLDGARDHPSRCLGLSKDQQRRNAHQTENTYRTTLHGERLARARLTVCENTDVVSISAALRKLRDLLKDL